MRTAILSVLLAFCIGLLAFKIIGFELWQQSTNAAPPENAAMTSSGVNAATSATMPEVRILVLPDLPESTGEPREPFVSDVGKNTPELTQFLSVSSAEIFYQANDDQVVDIGVPINLDRFSKSIDYSVNDDIELNVGNPVDIQSVAMQGREYVPAFSESENVGRFIAVRQEMEITKN